MITTKQYFGGKPHTPAQEANATKLLVQVNNLIDYASRQGVKFWLSPATGCNISGSGNGGFRTPDCPIGSPDSAHKEAMAVDVYDPKGHFDGWLTDAILEQFDLYRESPTFTAGWTHLSTRAPKSGKRTFNP